jgi:UDP-N-acetylmuramate dehydrogenase
VTGRRASGPSAGGLRGRLRHEEPLARYTSWRVGGPARRCYEPADVDDLAAFLASLPAGEPVFWLGLGSNVLIRDGGIPGTVILTRGLLGRIEPTHEGLVRVEAGVPCAKVARFATRHGLAGAEFLAGIPGTMGGALAMNAGAFGGETWGLVARVESIDRAGRRRERPASDYRPGYREVRGPSGEWFVAAHLRLAAGDGGAAAERVRSLLRRRAETQPLGQPSCGSVFRNPPGDFAGRLVEACGLKGAKVGGACVSEKHANFIVNTGGASAADVETLIERVRVAVERTHGVRLETEVKVVGLPAPPGRGEHTGAGGGS